MKKKIKEWNETFQMKRKYSGNFPFCFYDLAGKYLPEDEKAVIVDVGCGRCRFEDYFGLWRRYENLVVLDGNPMILDKLRCKHDYFNIKEYIAPSRLPFEDKFVDYIFCGHLIEHFDFKELYILLKEFDRVLKIDGILVVSSPMLWDFFYGTFDHVKPYYPSVFESYFCSEDKIPSYPPISRTYKLEELVYRYHTFVDIHNTVGSSVKLIDLLIQATKYIFRALGIKKYTRSGYTIILRKK